MRISSILRYSSSLRRSPSYDAFRRQRYFCASALPSAPESRSEDDLKELSLYHRTVEFALRAGPKREKKEIRKSGKWIPSIIQGRGRFPDLRISVPVAPFLHDFQEGLFGNSKHSKLKWCGPLYELRPLPLTDTSHLEEDLQVATELPFSRIRVKAVNMELQAVKEIPKSIGFVYAPEDEPVRLRVPIRYINHEKCPGLKEGGYVNRIIWNVDVCVAPWAKAPKYAVQDLGGMHLKDQTTAGKLMFEGKGNGCRLVLADNYVSTTIAKI